MSSVVNYEELLLTKDVKRTFEQNYLKMLFQKHCELPKSDIINFLHKAQLTNANPALDQIFLIERNVKDRFGGWSKAGTVVYSYQFLQAIANQTGEYEGYTETIGLVEKFDINTFEVKKMLAATVVTKRKGNLYPYTAYLDEYIQTKDGKATGTWASKPYLMLSKCALSGSLRRSFPESMSGMYCEEEMESISNEIDKRENDDVIEAKAIEKVEKYEAMIEKAKPESVLEMNTTLEDIRDILGSLTKGDDAAGKANAMFEVCGVKKFADLKGKTPEELKATLSKAIEIRDEREKRALKSAAKPSFKLG